VRPAPHRPHVYLFAGRWGATWWLYCKAHELACLLRGPHPWKYVFPDLVACERCPVWYSGLDGFWFGWYR
jgi:hypothetical protein